MTLCRQPDRPTLQCDDIDVVARSTAINHEEVGFRLQRQDRMVPDPLGVVHALPGFGVRVLASGTRSYLVQYRNHRGRSRRVSLGRHGTLTPAEARGAARKLLLEAKLGSDPAQERQDARKGVTVKELSDRYLAEHAIPKKKPNSVATDDLNLKKHVLPVFRNRAVADISRADIASRSRPRISNT